MTLKFVIQFQSDTEKLETIKQFKEHQTPSAPEFDSFIRILNDVQHSSASTVSFSFLKVVILFRIFVLYIA